MVLEERLLEPSDAGVNRPVPTIRIPTLAQLDGADKLLDQLLVGVCGSHGSSSHSRPFAGPGRGVCGDTANDRTRSAKRSLARSLQAHNSVDAAGREGARPPPPQG